jgi:hypothetical protein
MWKHCLLSCYLGASRCLNTRKYDRQVAYLFRLFQLVHAQLNHTSVRMYEYTNLRIATETRPICNTSKWPDSYFHSGDRESICLFYPVLPVLPVLAVLPALPYLLCPLRFPTLSHLLCPTCSVLLCSVQPSLSYLLCPLHFPTLSYPLCPTCFVLPALSNLLCPTCSVLCSFLLCPTRSVLLLCPTCSVQPALSNLLCPATPRPACCRAEVTISYMAS